MRREQDIVAAVPAPRIPVLDDGDELVGRFPVRRILCVGRNYAEHAREMGARPGGPPFFFFKPASCVSTAASVPYPPRTSALHHEVELVVAFGEADATGLPVPVACGVGVDLTRRDLQQAMKDAQRPWEAGKVFSSAAPCGALRSGTAVLHRTAVAITLDVDGERRQAATLDDMIHDVDSLVREADALFGLLPGDLLFTGTPAGVAAVAPGQRLQARIDGLPALDFTITGQD